MILLAAQGLSNDEIANRLDTPRKVVSIWRKRFFKERLLGFDERLVRDAPRLFPPELIVQIKALACEPPSDPSSCRFPMECYRSGREVRRSD